MALKPCRECGHKVSSEAKTCPNCGARKPGWGRFAYAFPGLFALLIVGSCTVAAFSQETDIYYAELKQWVFKPCAEVGAAMSKQFVPSEKRSKITLSARSVPSSLAIRARSRLPLTPQITSRVGSRRVLPPGPRLSG